MNKNSSADMGPSAWTLLLGGVATGWFFFLRKTGLLIDQPIQKGVLFFWMIGAVMTVLVFVITLVERKNDIPSRTSQWSYMILGYWIAALVYSVSALFSAFNSLR